MRGHESPGQGGGGTAPLASEPGSSLSSSSEEAATLSSTLCPPASQRQLPSGELAEGELGPWGAVGIAGPAALAPLVGGQIDSGSCSAGRGASQRRHLMPLGGGGVGCGGFPSLGRAPSS